MYLAAETAAAAAIFAGDTLATTAVQFMHRKRLMMHARVALSVFYRQHGRVRASAFSLAKEDQVNENA
jgi:hypothetical protein